VIWHALGDSGNLPGKESAHGGRVLHKAVAKLGTATAIRGAS
jgi:hypothetical protein